MQLWKCAFRLGHTSKNEPLLQNGLQKWKLKNLSKMYRFWFQNGPQMGPKQGPEGSGRGVGTLIRFAPPPSGPSREPLGPGLWRGLGGSEDPFGALGGIYFEAHFQGRLRKSFGSDFGSIWAPGGSLRLPMGAQGASLGPLFQHMFFIPFLDGFWLPLGPGDGGMGDATSGALVKRHLVRFA